MVDPQQHRNLWSFTVPVCLASPSPIAALSICTEPHYNLSSAHAPAVRHWLDYHRERGVARVHLYDTDGSLAQLLPEEDVQSGFIHYTPRVLDTFGSKYNDWRHGRVRCRPGYQKPRDARPGHVEADREWDRVHGEGRGSSAEKQGRPPRSFFGSAARAALLDGAVPPGGCTSDCEPSGADYSTGRSGNTTLDEWAQGEDLDCYSCEARQSFLQWEAIAQQQEWCLESAIHSHCMMQQRGRARWTALLHTIDEYLEAPGTQDLGGAAASIPSSVRGAPMAYVAVQWANFAGPVEPGTSPDDPPWQRWVHRKAFRERPPEYVRERPAEAHYLEIAGSVLVRPEQILTVVGGHWGWGRPL
eukprot:CAMPEP_0204369104 /NCGR_PEP_ID=MMETSP0469-20131031/44703_1 /ASSEMBLY_ACC=CAM_ASM_000384 /TAXON_ID=2969 /ORGANISM="Oxyrrhis marina" /LENGTH=357 /DNA_ID=CAMNT_0051358777 /DNA_START=20 /DNA_END=1090 /DNA_ORIENTATION=-